MKTAESWYNESDTHWGEGRCSMTQSTIEAIQADAFAAGERKGMERAAEIVLNCKVAVKYDHDKPHNTTCELIHRSVFNAAKEVK